MKVEGEIRTDSALWGRHVRILLKADTEDEINLLTQIKDRGKIDVGWVDFIEGGPGVKEVCLIAEELDLPVKEQLTEECK